MPDTWEVTDQEELDLVRGREGYPRLEDIKMTWGDKHALRGMISMILRQLEAKFGPVSKAVHQELEANESKEEIKDLAIRLLDADSLEDLGLA